MSKFYAVRKGKKTGIFDNWNECKENVQGFSNAEYKSFSSLNEAEFYMSKNSETSDEANNINIDLSKAVKAYVDGSYSKSLRKSSYGCVMVDSNTITRISGRSTEKNGSNLWNVSGELSGALKAIEWAIKKNFKHIIIYYDYEGISKWANGEWKAKKDETKKYVENIQEYKRKINIEFVKVKAHSGDKYNEEADKLAKKALINNEAPEEKLTQYNSSHQEMLWLFKKIISSEEQVSSDIFFTFNEYKLTERKLKKFAKEYWKILGNRINEIESLKVNFDYQNGMLDWHYVKKDGNKLDFELLIDNL